MRTFMSYFGLFLLALAMMLLGADMVTSLEHPGPITLRSFQTIWSLFDAHGFNVFAAWLVRSLPQFLANAILTVLRIPAWSIGIIGVIITFIFSRKREDV